MDEQSDSSQERSPAATSPIQVTQPPATLPAQAATEEHLTKVEGEMNAFEQSTIRWARVAVLMSGAAALFVCLQWWEMHTGSGDTHALADAAKRQADAAKSLAEQATTQTNKMAESLAKTDTLIQEATAQADATNRLATEAKRSADIAHNALVISNRPYVGVADSGVTIIAEDQGRRANFHITVKNFGNAPARDFFMDWTVRFGGVIVAGDTVGENHPSGESLFPSQTKALSGWVGRDEYVNFVTGKKSLDLVFALRYTDDEQHYQECGSMHYAPQDSVFLNTGRSCEGLEQSLKKELGLR
jgi:hypothetical protein